MLYNSVFSNVKSIHSEDLDDCMRDDFRVQWFEVFAENKEEKKELKQQKRPKKMQKLKK